MPPSAENNTEEKLTNLSDRLNYALKQTGISQADVARQIGVKPQTIQYLCSKNAQWSKFTFELSNALGISVEWLATGEGEMQPKQNSKGGLLSQQTEVPLYDIKTLKRVVKNNSLENLPSPSNWTLASYELKDNSFAIILESKAMWPRFDEGSLLIFTKKKNPAADNFVLAYIKALDDIIFRKYERDDNNNIILAPLNTRLYKTVMLSDNDLIIGTMVEARWRIDI